MPVIICLMGPTASGKTQLAIDLLQSFPFEIISVDSAMVYRDMNIGTAKPSADILKSAPHRLIDFRDPSDAYSAADFRQDALREIKDIFSRGKIPLLVGGTMLYFRVLQQGLSDLPSANVEVRERLSKEAEKHGWPFLHDKLTLVDPSAALRIHPNDAQRIQRALEVYEISGKNLTTWQQESGDVLEYFQMINIAIAPNDRAILHERIAQRFEKMLEEGLVLEVKKLMARGDLDLNTPSMRSVGYRQVWDYLQNKLTYDEMRERGIIATRQLAKRQLTWVRSWPELKWFDSEVSDLKEQVARYLSSILFTNPS
jgi:tRNA dimethylallyltransferase